MSYVCKFEPVHKRVLGYFGYTLLEAQSLPEHERRKLRDRIQDAFGGFVDEPAELFDEDGLIRDEEWLALDDLSEMIFWPPASTVLVDDDYERFTEHLEVCTGAASKPRSMTPWCMSESMPACNYTEQVGIENIGYAQGMYQDGMPFVAELYSGRPGSLGLNIILPEIPQYISYKNVGTASDFPDSVSEGQDNGVLSIGMAYRERDNSLEELMYYTQYLEDMGVLEFTTDLREGSLEMLADLQGNPVVLNRVSLETNGDVLAKARLEFRPFPNGPNRFFEEEQLRDIFCGCHIDVLPDEQIELFLSEYGSDEQSRLMPNLKGNGMSNESEEIMPEGASDDFNSTPVELLIKDPSYSGRIMTLPGRSEERSRLDEVPDELLLGKKLEFGGWCTILRLVRRNLQGVYDFIYEGDEAELPCIDGDPDDEIEIIGFWD